MIRVRKIQQVGDKKNERQRLEMIKSTKTSQQSKQFAVVQIMPAPTVTMVPMSKLTVIKNTKPAVVFPAAPSLPASPVKAQVYQQRKVMLTEYREIFAALMRLQDKDLQRKILKVINDHQTVEYRSMETQTEPLDIKDISLLSRPTQQQTYIIHSIVPEFKTLNSPASSAASNESGTNTEHIIPKNETPTGDSVDAKIKRKRKRKVALPQANKESRVARHLAKLNQASRPISKNRSSSHLPAKTCVNPAKRLRMDSFALSECSSDVFNILEDVSETEASKQQLLLNLVKDVFLADIELENGLLPIHETIIKGQYRNLDRQIYIWKDYKKKDLNELVTNYDEDLLQLAIFNTVDPTIIQLLLDKGLNPNCLDAQSNTVIHLAILNDINVLSLEHLMKHIDLKLLVTLNDEGYSPLHLAIRQDRYLLAERIINILDERLLGHVFYKREIDDLETDEAKLKKQFKDYYDKICFSMDIEDESACIINNPDLKQQLLQAGDRRSGNISLYFAIENRSEHLIYFLLAHLTDPRTENLSGQDCKTYFSEFGKSLGLSLNIDNAMEKVIKILS